MHIIPTKNKSGQKKLVQTAFGNSSVSSKSVTSSAHARKPILPPGMKDNNIDDDKLKPKNVEFVLEELNMLSDDNEIKSLKKSMGNSVSSVGQSCQRAEAILAKSKVKLDEKVRERVIQILIPQIEGIRKLFETKSRLYMKVGQGGAELPEKKIDPILQAYLDMKHPSEMARPADSTSTCVGATRELPIVELQPPPPSKEVIKEIQPPTPLVLEKKKQEKPKDLSTSIKSFDSKTAENISVGQNKKVTSNVSKPNKEEKIQSLSSVIEEKEEILSSPAPRSSKNDKEDSIIRSKHLAEKQPSKVSVSPKVTVSSDEQPEKVKKEDVIPQVDAVRPMVKDMQEYKAHLVGPLEELRSMTLVDFRRLAKSAKVATQKVLNKIDLLGEDSLKKKLDGITAWKESEVMQTYLKIGQQSLLEGLKIVDVIERREKNNESYLDMGEFNAIMDMNDLLREFD